MDIFNKLSGIAKQYGIKTPKVNGAVPGVGNKTKTFTFNSLPHNVQELQALPEASLTDVYATAALSLLALANYETDKAACFEMLNFLKGPEPLC